MIWAVIILALGLRLINLNQSLWLDEATQAITSSKPLGYIIFERGGDFHPPLSYILLHFWMMLGASEIWLRLLSVLFGVGTIILIYLLTKKLFDEKLALLSALFLAIAPYHIYYSQEVRMYSAAAFFATASVYFLCSLIKDDKKTINGLFYISSTILLTYIHYLGLFLLVAQLLFILLKKRKIIKLFLVNLGLISILWLPWLPLFLQQLESGINAEKYLPGWSSVLSLSVYKAIPLTFLKFSIGRIDFDNNVLYGFIALIVLSIFSYLLIHGIRSTWKKDASLLVFWLVVPLILTLLVSFQIPLNQPFRLLFVLPAFYILLAVGVTHLKKLQKVATTLIIFISFSGLATYYINPKFWREDWRGATNFINQNIKEDEKVLFVWSQPFPPYEWYQGSSQVIGLTRSLPIDIDQLNKNNGSLMKAKGIYLFEYLQGLSDPGRLTQSWLTQNGYILMRTYDFRGVGFIYKYSK